MSRVAIRSGLEGRFTNTISVIVSDRISRYISLYPSYPDILGRFRLVVAVSCLAPDSDSGVRRDARSRAHRRALSRVSPLSVSQRGVPQRSRLCSHTIGIAACASHTQNPKPGPARRESRASCNARSKHCDPMAALAHWPEATARQAACISSRPRPRHRRARRRCENGMRSPMVCDRRLSGYASRPRRACVPHPASSAPARAS